MIGQAMIRHNDPTPLLYRALHPPGRCPRHEPLRLAHARTRRRYSRRLRRQSVPLFLQSPEPPSALLCTSPTTTSASSVPSLRRSPCRQSASSAPKKFSVLSSPSISINPPLIPLPPGSDIRSVYLVDPGLAVIDVNAAFADGHRSGVLAEELTVASLIQTLSANIPGILKVKILVEGKQRDTLAGHADLSNFFDVSAVNQLTVATPVDPVSVKCGDGAFGCPPDKGRHLCRFPTRPSPPPTAKPPSPISSEQISPTPPPANSAGRKLPPSSPPSAPGIHP